MRKESHGLLLLRPACRLVGLRFGRGVDGSVPRQAREGRWARLPRGESSPNHVIRRGTRRLAVRSYVTQHRVRWNMWGSVFDPSIHSGCSTPLPAQWVIEPCQGGELNEGPSPSTFPLEQYACEGGGRVL